MRNSFWIACLAACASTQAQRPDNRGWAERMQDANRHEDAAAQHEEGARQTYGSMGAAAYTCGDQVLSDQSTTGGMPVTTWAPCWNVEEESTQHQRFLADKEHELARNDR